MGRSPTPVNRCLVFNLIIYISECTIPSVVAPSAKAPQDEDFTGYTTTQSQVSTPSFSPPRVLSVVFSAVRPRKNKTEQQKFETAESSMLYASSECDRKGNTPLFILRPFLIYARTSKKRSDSSRLARLVVNLEAFVRGGK